MVLPAVVGVLFAYFALFVHGKKLHEHMTKEEIQSVFNVKHDSIHEVDYDILLVDHSAKRDVYMKSSSQEYFLYLEDNDVLLGSETPIYKAKYNTSNKRPYYTKTFFKDYFPGSLKFYHDHKHQAAFAVHTDENHNRHFDGVIGKLVHIRSIPDRLHKEFNRNFTALLELLPAVTNPPRDAFTNNATYHVIITKSNKNIATDDARNSNSNNNVLAQGTNIPPLLPHIYETRERTVYPEILITADYKTFGLHGYDIKNIAKYIAAFWHAVDLRYRELRDPKVRLNIAGLIISEDALAVPTITETNNYNAKKFVDVTSRFFTVDQKDTFSTDSYDAIVAMTSEALDYYDEEKMVWKSPGGVFAHRGRACHAVDRAAVISDDGGFRYITSAARQLGHLFGAKHDPKRSHDDCDSAVGYIMSHTIEGHTHFRWSRCSKEAMKAFFNSEDSNCLKNKPNNVGSLYPKILPGTLLSRDEQCYKLFGTMATRHFEDYLTDCEILWCVPRNAFIIFGLEFSTDLPIHRSIPAEGTSCGTNRICLDGYCVEDSPTYHSTKSIWDQ